MMKYSKLPEISRNCGNRDASMQNIFHTPAEAHTLSSATSGPSSLGAEDGAGGGGGGGLNCHSQSSHFRENQGQQVQ